MKLSLVIHLGPRGRRAQRDDNANVEYPELEGRIKETYASRVDTKLKNSLYDTYKMAIRWATDRLQEQKHGIVAFVTPASWIDGNVDAGIRACLTEGVQLNLCSESTWECQNIR